MTECCGAPKGAGGNGDCPLTWFDGMIPHSLEYAEGREPRPSGENLLQPAGA